MVDLYGLLAAMVAIVFFGSNFVPIKNYKTGDGLYFQFMLCLGIWIVGLIVFISRGCPEFHPIVMTGGALWASGNMFTVPIVQRIGLGIGLLIWGFASMLSGWASARFGILGLTPDEITSPTLNTLGVLCAILSLPLYLLIRADVKGQVIHVEELEGGRTGEGLESNTIEVGAESQVKQEDDNDENTGLLVRDKEKEKLEKDSKLSAYKRLKVKIQRHENLHEVSLINKVIGWVMALVSGLCYGLTFNPSQHVMHNVPGASQNGLDYVFPHFCGVLLASTTYFILYIIFKKNKPELYPECTLPALISGSMWAVAQSSWFIANQKLSPSIAFPIVTSGPGMVASIFWGVFVFKEIRGIRNYLVLAISLGLVIGAGILTSLSK